MDEEVKMWAVVYNVRIGEDEHGEEIRVFGTYQDAERIALKELHEWWGSEPGETLVDVFNDRSDVTLMYEAWDNIRSKVVTISDITPLTGTTAYLPDGREVIFDIYFERS